MLSRENSKICHLFKKLKCNDQELNTLRNQIKIYDEKLKQSTQEMSFKDDQLMIYKTELQSTQEKLKYKSEEVNQNQLS